MEQLRVSVQPAQRNLSIHILTFRTTTDILQFQFCTSSPSFTADSIYYFQIKLASSSAPMELIFGDSTAQSLVYGPSFASPKTLDGGVSFNLTVGSNVPNCQRFDCVFEI